MRLQDLPDAGGMSVHFVSGDLSVEGAIDLMAQSRAGALIIAHQDQPVGIFTERDVMRCHANYRGRPISQVMVRQVMTNRLFVAESTEKVSEALSTMLQMDIHHLPVAEGGRITRIIPLREIVQHHVASLNAELRYLHDYLADLQEAGQD